MFDKLIESGSNTKDKKDRSSYFAVSTFLMSAALIAGLLVSIFGANYDIGNPNMDISQLLAPIETKAPEPEPQPKQESQPQNESRSTELPIRTKAYQRIDETPKEVVPVATARVDFKERPLGQFRIGDTNVEPQYVGGREDGTSSATPKGSGDGTGTSASSERTIPPPPIKKPEVNPNTVVSLGAVNGKAVSLPKPAYPETARAIRAEGAVQIQITIDKDGSVISAKAVGGHPLLRAAAENAARRAKFSPTKLSNVPVKATGIITYNFKLG